MFTDTKAALVYGQGLIGQLVAAKGLQDSNRTWLDFVTMMAEVKCTLDAELEEALEMPNVNKNDVMAYMVRLQHWMRRMESEFMQTKSSYEQGQQAFLKIRIPV